MSQHPYSLPQSQPVLGYAPHGRDPLALIRRASTMLLILGALSLLLGLCTGAFVLAISKDQLHAMIEKQPMPAMPSLPPGVTPEEYLLASSKLTAIAGLVGATILIFLGIFVRRASKAAAVFGVIICGLVLLYLILSLVNAAAIGGGAMIAAGGCMFSVPIVLFALTTKWLLDVLKALPHIASARLQWQQQYAAMQQHQQAYLQGSYGSGQPPPGGTPPISQPSIGYGAMPAPPTTLPGQGGFPVRHPPSPPDQKDPVEERGDSQLPPPD